MATRITGGHRLRQFMQLAGRGGVKRIELGFFETARYPDGTPVAAVAAWNEFGHHYAPERPFFRIALNQMQDPIKEIIKEEINRRNLVVDKPLADKIGAYAQGALQQSITDLTSPANAPSTIARKGSSNPLVDTSTMRTAATWKVEE